MVRPVALYLARFDEKKENSPDEASIGGFEGLGKGTPERAENSVSEAIRQELFEEARMAVKGEFEAIMEVERARFGEHLNAERSRWSLEEGARLGEQFHKAINGLATNLETNLGQVLEPFVIQAVRERMVSSLVAQVRSLLADRKSPVVQLSGPTDLLEVVRAQLNIADVATNVADSDGIDVKARLDSTVIETRMQEWLQYLRSGETDVI